MTIAQAPSLVLYILYRSLGINAKEVYSKRASCEIFASAAFSKIYHHSESNLSFTYFTNIELRDKFQYTGSAIAMTFLLEVNTFFGAIVAIKIHG